jgi:hypothetical protein
MALAAAPSMVSLAPAATQFLNPTTVATLATLAAEDAENPAAEEETIEQDGNICVEETEEVLQNAEKRITVSRWGRPGLQPGDWVMKGKTNFWNYLRSGKWDPSTGNQFAKFSSGKEYQVPISSLKYPNGPKWYDCKWKGILFGQRRYYPW